MKLHEYQAKELLASYGISVPISGVATTADEAVAIAKTLATDKVVVKAQVHAGGRGKAGGVKVCATHTQVKEYAASILGTRLVTFQTDAKGQPVNSVLVEQTSEIKNELYLGIVIDTGSKRMVVMVSTEGGTEIETVAATMPEKIHRISIEPITGYLPWQGRQLGFKLGFNLQQVKEFSKILGKMVKMFAEKDLGLLEVNPLIIDGDDKIVCLDGKIDIDSNALYRNKELYAIWDKTQEDPKELHAKEWDLNYITLEGNIGCMVNGAGLAMATMDIIKYFGGSPANFLDVGGTATAERVSEALRIILSDTKVKGVLINIFGGIVRCDLIAQGIIEAVKTLTVQVPLMVRLEGTNSDIGKKLLSESGLNLLAETNLKVAAKQIVAMATSN